MSQRDEQIESLIREIAEKHGIVVGRDDPIFVLQTINNRLMQDSATAQQALLDRFKQELEDMARRWGDDARSSAERILAAALRASKQAMTGLLEEGARVSATAVQAEIDVATNHLTRPLREAGRLALCNLAASLMTLLGAALALLTVMSA